MKRTLFIITVILAGTILLIGSMAVFICRSNAAHQYIISRINQMIPGTFTLNRLHISPFHLQVELCDLALADSSGARLAAFDRLSVVISTAALFRKAIVIKKAILERPQVLLSLDSNGTLSLLRAFPQGHAATKAPTNSMQQQFPHLEIRNCTITGGAVIFTARQDSVQVQVFGLSLSAAGSTVPVATQAALSIDSVLLHRNGTVFRLHAVNLGTHMKKFAIDTASLSFRTDSSAFTLCGRTSSFTDTPYVVHLTATTGVALSELRSLLAVKESLDGKALVQLRVDGAVSNPDLDLSVSYGGGVIMGYPLDSLGIRALLHDRRATPFSLRIVPDNRGTADITGDIDLREMFPRGFLGAPGPSSTIHYRLAIVGKDIPLEKQGPVVSGTAAISARLDGYGIAPDSLVAHATVNAKASSLKLDNSLYPFDVATACSVSLDQGTVRLHNMAAAIGSTKLSLNGSYHIPSGTVASDLNVVVPSLEALLGCTGIDSIGGSARLLAHVYGDREHPYGSIGLTTDSISVRMIHAGTASLDAQLNRTGVLSIKRMTIANRNSQIELSGRAKILDAGRPVPVNSMAFNIGLTGKHIEINDFYDTIHGTVQVDAKIQGPVGNLDGTIHCSAHDVSAGGQHISNINIDSRLDGDRVHLQRLAVTIAPGMNITAAGWASMKDSFSVALQLPGIHLNSLETVAAIDSLDGILSVNLTGGGTYLHPAANGNVLLKKLHKGSSAFDDIAIDFTLLDNFIEASGTAGGPLYALYDMKSRSFSADLRCQDLLLTPYLALSGRQLSGMLTADMSAWGSTDSLSAIKGYLHVGRLTLDYDTIHIAEATDLNASVEGNRYTVPEFRLTLATDGRLECRANGSFSGPHDITLNGTVPLSVVRHIAPDLPEMDGTINIDATLRGKADITGLNATARFVNAGIAIPGIEQRLHTLNGRILADQHAIRIESLSGNLDDGRFTIGGDIKLDNLAPGDMRAMLVLDNLPVSIPDMLDLVIDGKLRMSGTPAATMVDGDIEFVDGLYYKDLVLNPLDGSGERRRKVVPKKDTTVIPYLSGMRFDVTVQARSPFQVDNNLFQLTVSPDLHLGGALQQPVISGRANVREGTITYLNKTFTVKRGVVDFINPYIIEPNIDIEGTVPVRSRIIKIVLSGTPENLSFTLGCDNDPTLEDQDILSLLILGKTTSELQSDFKSNEPLQSSQQMIAALVTSSFGGEIKKSTGLDILDINTDNEPGDTASHFAITVGKKLTKRLSTTYRVESVDNEITQRAAVEYQLLQNLIVTGFQYLGGIYGGELKLTWERR